MQRTIITGSIFNCYRKDGENLVLIGTYKFSGAVKRAGKKELEAIMELYPDCEIAMFSKYETELRYMDDEFFIENSTIVED